MLKYCSDKKFDKMMSSLDIGTESPEYNKYMDWLDDIADTHKLHDSTWSADNVDFNSIAFPDTVKRIEHYTSFCEPTYASVPPNATYLDVWKILDKLIYDSGDCDHRFIEQFTIDGDTVRVFLGS